MMFDQRIYALAIDFGGTNIRGAIIDDKGKTHLSEKVPTEAGKGRTKVVSNLLEVIQRIRAGFKGKIEGIGVSMPGFIDDSGKVVFGGGTLRCLEGVNLKKAVHEKTGLPVFLENDANCFALAEAVFGAGKRYRVVVGVIWGTGIGGGIVVDKKLFRGSFGGAGEFGHMVVAPHERGEKCGCGQSGCLEMMSSGKNIVRRYMEGDGKIKDANARDVYDSKEPVAKNTILTAIHYFGLGLANLVNTLNPDIIILGGGVSKLPDKAYKLLLLEVKKYALPSHTSKLKIVRHGISDDAGLLGAAALVLEH
ncbi:ROK family protein [archaeon]|nr:ROK family protein [archaeon]